MSGLKNFFSRFFYVSKQKSVHPTRPKELDGRKKSRLISLAYAVERPHHILSLALMYFIFPYKIKTESRGILLLSVFAH